MSIATRLTLLILFILPLSTMAAINVLHYGAKPTGLSEATKAFLGAWSTACRSPKPLTIYVPKGRYYISSIVFQGPCRSKVSFLIMGTIIAPSNYAVHGSSGSWIEFNRVDGLFIYGATLDGKGASLWACKKARRSCPYGPASLSIARSKNVRIKMFKSINSKFFHMFIHNSEHVTVQSAKLYAPANSPNTDGIHVQISKDIRITSSTIMTGDDCISIGPGTSKMWIENIHCGPGHGISIGSLGHNLNEPGVENVVVRKTVFVGTQNGLRIKTWGRNSNGFVKGVVFQHANMKNVQNPILIDQNYCPSGNGCPNQPSGIKISDVKFMNIKGTSARNVGVGLDCSSRNPCSGIRLHDVKLTFQNKPIISSCKHAHGKSSSSIGLDNCL